MAKIKYYLELNKKNKKQGTIYLILSHGAGKKVKYSIQKHVGRVEKKDWDFKRERFKGKSLTSIVYNDILTAIEKKANELLILERINSFKKEEDINIIKVRNEVRAFFDTTGKFKTKTKGAKSLYELYKEYIDKKIGLLSESSIRVYKRYMEHIKEYDIKGVLLSEIDSKFGEKYKKFLLSKKYLNGTVNREIKQLITVLKGYEHSERFEKVISRITSIKNKDKVDNKFPLSQKEVDFLRDYVVKDDFIIEAGKRIIVSEKTLDKVKDLFLFSCFSSLAYSDFNNLRYSNVQKVVIDKTEYEVINYNRIKTKKNIFVPLSSGAKKIIEKYKGKQGDKILPTITNQRMNNYLHILLKQTNIFNDEVLIVNYSGNKRIEDKKHRYDVITAHSGRHTFATIYSNLGIPITHLQKMMGHSDLKTTMGYVHIDEKAIILGARDI